MKNITLLVLLVLISCASKEDQQKEYCNPTGAHDKGYNDGKDNKPLSSKALSFCSQNQNELMKSYREGYEKGQAIYAQTPKAPTSALGSSPNAGLPQKCLMQYRGDTFMGEGYSLGDAIQNAQEKCVRAYGSQCPQLPCEQLK